MQNIVLGGRNVILSFVLQFGLFHSFGVPEGRSNDRDGRSATPQYDSWSYHTLITKYIFQWTEFIELIKYSLVYGLNLLTHVGIFC